MHSLVDTSVTINHEGQISGILLLFTGLLFHCICHNSSKLRTCWAFSRIHLNSVFNSHNSVSNVIVILAFFCRQKHLTEAPLFHQCTWPCIVYASCCCCASHVSRFKVSSRVCKLSFPCKCKATPRAIQYMAFLSLRYLIHVNSVSAERDFAFTCSPVYSSSEMWDCSDTEGSEGSFLLKINREIVSLSPKCQARVTDWTNMFLRCVFTCVFGN